MTKSHEIIHCVTAQTFIMPLYDLFSLFDFIPCGLSDYVLLRGYEWDINDGGWNEIAFHEVEMTEEIYPVAKDRHFRLLGEESKKTGKIKYVGAFNFVSPMKYVNEELGKIIPCDEKEAAFFAVFEWDCEGQYWGYWPDDENGRDGDMLFFDKKVDAYKYATKKHLFLCEKYDVNP